MTLYDRLIRYFELDAHGTDVRTEALAGLTTFLTMSYIVVVNPAILAQSTGAGGDVTAPGIAIEGVPAGDVVQMLAVVTILAAALATLVMALYANRPFGLAPGMGLNAFFAFTVVGTMGIPWETALAAVVVEGVLFVVLTLVGVRRYVIELFPTPVKQAVGAGIGLFLAIIGLQEMHVVVADPATLVALGNIAADPVAGLSVAGLLLTLALYARGVRGAIVLGVLATAAAGWGAAWMGVAGPDPSVSLAPTMPVPRYDITPLVGAFLDGFARVDLFAFALVVLTFFFVDFFDTAGTLTGVGQAAGLLDARGNLPDIDKPLLADAVGTTVGGMLGTSTVTAYVESATGVEEGGRTGLTALVVALLFLASLAVVPLAAAIPLYASHIALVVVALLMLRGITAVDWANPAHAIPAGLTVIVMPFTFSIAYGIAAGLISYPLIKLARGEGRDVLGGQWILALLLLGYLYVQTSGAVGA